MFADDVSEGDDSHSGVFGEKRAYPVAEASAAVQAEFDVRVGLMLNSFGASIAEVRGRRPRFAGTSGVRS